MKKATLAKLLLVPIFAVILMAGFSVAEEQQPSEEVTPEIARVNQVTFACPNYALNESFARACLR